MEVVICNGNGVDIVGDGGGSGRMGNDSGDGRNSGRVGVVVTVAIISVVNVV